MYILWRARLYCSWRKLVTMWTRFRVHVAASNKHILSCVVSCYGIIRKWYLEWQLVNYTVNLRQRLVFSTIYKLYTRNTLKFSNTCQPRKQNLTKVEKCRKLLFNFRADLSILAGIAISTTLRDERSYPSVLIQYICE